MMRHFLEAQDALFFDSAVLQSYRLGVHNFPAAAGGCDFPSARGLANVLYFSNVPTTAGMNAS